MATYLGGILGLIYIYIYIYTEIALKFNNAIRVLQLWSKHSAYTRFPQCRLSDCIQNGCVQELCMYNVGRMCSDIGSLLETL